jgi:carboxylate-amine ligase
VVVSAPETPRAAKRGSWARWKDIKEPCTVGVEEEVMLLEAADLSLAQRSDAVIGTVSRDLREHTSRETHAGVLELATGVHRYVAGAVKELSGLRRDLAVELRSVDAVPACAGMHPLASRQETKVSATERYRMIADSMRWLALREPTMALHVHVAVPDPEGAVRVLRRMRENVPLLVALSANSPFSGGHDTGFASARTPTFGGFPRTGPPRAFANYDEYVDAVGALIASGAVPEPTFLWWDVRPQPRLGTVEVRVMDAQSTVADIAPLVALVQSLARLELEHPARQPPATDEVLAENRFIAARDGLDARLIDSSSRKLISVRALLDKLVEECLPHAAALGCLVELEHAARLITANGAIRQRTWISAGRDLRSLLGRLSHQFTAPIERLLTPV